MAPADFVVLNRVVCCYPDYERLLGAAAGHARRALVFSYPPRNGLSRSILGVENLVFRLQRQEFRTFAHPPGAMLGLLERHGFRARTSTAHWCGRSQDSSERRPRSGLRSAPPCCQQFRTVRPGRMRRSRAGPPGAGGSNTSSTSTSTVQGMPPVKRT